MKKHIVLSLLILISFMSYAQTRVIVIGAHPDDCELITGGSTIKLLDKGHKVKFVSLTNGNKGHHQYTTDQIKQVREKEVENVRKNFDLEYEVLDFDDGELVPTLEARDKVIQLIREWKADVVIFHPPYDYHPDHRNTSTLVQDAAFLVTVPLAVPEVPYLRDNPVFLYMVGRLDNPYRKTTEIIVDIEPVLDRKVTMLSAHRSQFYEWLPWINQDKEPIPESEEGKLAYLTEYIKKRNEVKEHDIDAVERWYGKEFIDKIKVVERYEFCPFGRKISEEELKVLLPIF